MAPNNTDNDELRRRESAKAQEANNNTDSPRNDADDGEEGGQAGQKVVSYEQFFYFRKISLNADYYQNSLPNFRIFLFRDFHTQNQSVSSLETNFVKDFHSME